MNKHSQQEAVWCFRRWSRKPWAAFAGLRQFRYGVLSVAMSIILLATHIAGAQTVGTDSLSQYSMLHLDTVQVGASQMAATVKHVTVVPQTRFLVDQKGIAPLGTSEAALRLLPAVDVRERGGKSSQADIAIRGGSFDQTMVMLNGVDFSDPRTGHQSHSLPVDLDILSDIALIDGVAQPGALAGAVNFRTAPAYTRYLRARLEGGRWGYGYGNLSGAFEAGDLKVLGAASYRRSDGYRYNTDFWNVNAYTFVEYDSPKAGIFTAQGGFQRREWGSNGFYSLAYPDQFESTLTGLASLRWTKIWNNLTVIATGSFRRNNDRFEMERGDLSAIPFNFHTSYSTSGELYADYDWKRAGNTSLGVNYMRHQMFSTAMGFELDRPSHRIPGRDAFYPKATSRDIVSAWASHDKSWSKVWAHGFGTVSHTPYGTDGTFGAEAVWHPGRIFHLRGMAMRSMRLPTFTELFYNVATYHPNPDLNPEKAMTYRLTVEAWDIYSSSSSKWKADASVWYRRTRDVIDWEQRENGDWYSTQLNRLNTVGAELTARYNGTGWLRIAMFNYGYVHSDKNVATDYISKYALDYMRHKLSAMVGVAFLRTFTLTLTGSFYDRVGSYIAADRSRQGYRPYFLLDGRLAWEPRTKRRTGVQLYVDVTNMTRTRYFDFGGLPMPGVWATGGIVITVK